jgi:hypothetical protein
MIRSEFQGDYGDLTPDGLYDREVAALIAQMGDNPAKPQPGVQAIAVFLANRYKVMSLGDLQFLWTPDSQECGGNDEAYNCVAIPGFFTAIVKHNDLRIPQEFAHFDDGRATYYLGFKPTANGQPGFGLLYVNPRARGVFREVALPLLAIGSLVYDWSGQLGYAILGAGNAAAATTLSLEIAMASGLTQLQVAQLVGSAAVGAVTSGGDVGAAVKNTAAAYLGAQAGNFVTAAVDSAAAAKIASAAVSAAARGEDVGRAILETGAPIAASAAAGAVASTTGASVENYLFPNESGFIDPSELVGFDEWNIPPTDFVPSIDFGNDYPFVPGDVVVTAADLGIDVAITVNESDLVADLDPNALFPDDSGVLFNVAGEVVAYTPESFIEGIYYDTNNDVFLTPDNRLLITRQEAIDAVEAGAAGCSSTGAGLNGPTNFCQTPEQSIAAKILSKVGPQAGQTVIPAPGSNDRPAATPTPNPNGVKLPEAVGWAAAAEMITKSAANIWSTINQVSNGTYRPGATSPYGTLRPPVPGIPVTNRDGSVTVNNGNGTQTITYPNGTRTTMSTAVAGSGGFGGISTNTLLLVGAGLAAALLLRRK